ncbi:MAG: hypothetical protein ACW981_16000 [Candidatus Hodarchaeales archaeon]|jgi:hypothetical protein
MSVISYPYVILFYLILIGPLMVGVVQKMKQPGFNHFNLVKLFKYQKMRRNGLILFLFNLILIIYTSFFPTFTLLTIIAWFGLFFSILLIAQAQDRIYLINKSKTKLKEQLESLDNNDLLKLAEELEYPYTDLKMAVNYLMKKGELSKEFF